MGRVTLSVCRSPCDRSDKGLHNSSGLTNWSCPEGMPDGCGSGMTRIKVLTLYRYEANASSGISMMDISSFLMALTAASTSGSTFLMKYLALASLPV